MEIYLIRHGETEWNKLSRLQGQSNIELNQEGRDQSQKLNGVLQTLGLLAGSTVISSDLLRAHQTAEIATGLPVYTHKELREVNLGQAEGMTRDEIGLNFGVEALIKWSPDNNQEMEYKFPNGESRREVKTRMLDIMELLPSIYPNSQRILVFSHGLSLRMILTHLKGFQADRIPNCGMFKILHINGVLEWPQPRLNMNPFSGTQLIQE